MKKSISILFTFFAFIAFNFAQIVTPSASPGAKLTQVVGLTDVTIEYSRPSMKGRTIFGGLVPFGETWRTGANSATKITFSKEVKVGDGNLKAGSYALLTKPGKEEWDVMFFEYKSGNWGSYTEEGVTPAVHVKVKPSDLGFKLQTFMIGINNITDNSADIGLVWESTSVSIPFEVHTEKEVMASIDKTMAGPSQNDYYNAAVYMRNSGKDLNTALNYMNKGIPTENPRFWQLRQKSLLLADMGKKAEAIAAAKQSLELATKAGNNDYVRMNEASIAEWSGKGMMKKSIKK